MKSFNAHSIDWHKTGLVAWYALILLQPFNKFGALRILSAVVLIIGLVGGFCHVKLTLTKQLAPRIALAIALWAICASLLGPYPLDSLHAIRKDLLIQALMLTAALTYVRTTDDVWRVIGVALAGFGSATILSLIEIGNYWIHNGFSLWVPRNHDSFWGGYASTGSYYLPLLAGWLLAAPKKPAWNFAGWILFSAAVFLTFIYGSRSPLVAIAVATLFLLILLKRWQILTVASLLILCLFGLIQLSPSSHLDKYKTLMDWNTYVTNSGLSQRLSVWEGCWHAISERPLMGYGYGWKKLAWVINDGNFAKLWETRPDITAYFLDNGKAVYGKVNPHNYFLQIIFEIGAIGLALVLAFWFWIVRTGLVLLRHAEQKAKELAACLLVVLLGYATANLTNGYWVGSLANLSLVFAGCLLALDRSTRDCNKA